MLTQLCTLVVCRDVGGATWPSFGLFGVFSSVVLRTYSIHTRFMYLGK